MANRVPPPPPPPPQTIMPYSMYSKDSQNLDEGLYQEIEIRLPPPPAFPPPKPPQTSGHPTCLKRVTRRYPKIAIGIGILFTCICLSTIIALWIGLPKSSVTTTTTVVTTISTQTTSASTLTTTSITAPETTISATSLSTITSITEIPISSTSPGDGPDLGSYLMVLNTISELTYSEVEVLSLETEHPLPSCLGNLNNAPFIADEGAGAALSDGTPLVCAVDGKCYKYLPDSDTWQEMLDDMIDARYGSGYAYNDEMGLVMSGGYVEVCVGQTCSKTYDYALETVERNDGYSIEAMTPLPDATAHSCLVSVGNETLYLTGGSNRKLDKSTLMFSASTNNWREAADMSEGRYSHCCGIVNGPNGTNIIVVGGGDTLSVTSNTEVYNIEEGTWRQGTPFPHPITSAASVQYDGTILVVGGKSEGIIYETYDEIYKYNPPTESWEKLNVKLQKPASGLVAFMVPKYIFPTC